MHEEVHTTGVPRSRPEQGRISLPGPMRGEVFRGQRQSLREDARGGAAEGWWVDTQLGDGRAQWDEVAQWHCMAARIQEGRRGASAKHCTIWERHTA